MNQLTTTTESGSPMPENLRAIIAANIAELRKSRSMTQQDLADALEVSRQTINAIEKGKFNPSTILALKISNLFQKSVNEIFSLEDTD